MVEHSWSLPCNGCVKPNFSVKSKEEIAREKREFSTRVAKRLTDLRKEKGLTQEQLAFKAGYSRNVIGNFEQAVNSPTAHTVWRLAAALDVDPGEFFKSI